MLLYGVVCEYVGLCGLYTDCLSLVVFTERFVSWLF